MAKRKFSAAQLAAQRKFAARFGGRVRKAPRKSPVARKASRRSGRRSGGGRRMFGVNLRSVGTAAAGGAAGQVAEEILGNRVGPYAEPVGTFAAGVVLKDEWLQKMAGFQAGQVVVQGGATIGRKTSKKAAKGRLG